MSYEHEDDHEIEGEDASAKDEIAEDWEKGIPPFVRKLTKMVGENPDAIDWTAGGSFLVKEIDSFSSVLLPKYFKSIKFCSFVRQLNMYNFHKVEDLPHSNNKSMEFSNSFFLPGRKDLLKKIHRRKTVKRSKEDEEEEKSPKHENGYQPSPQLSPNGFVIDENAYKGLLHAVLRLQQEAEERNKQLQNAINDIDNLKVANSILTQKFQLLAMQQSVNNDSAQHPQTNVGFNSFSNQPNDLSTLLFSDDNTNNLLSSDGSNNRASLLSLMNDNLDNTFTPFDFNTLQQHLHVSGQSSSPPAISVHHTEPLLYETAQFDMNVIV